jgi:hypothetical protein
VTVTGCRITLTAGIACNGPVTWVFRLLEFEAGCVFDQVEYTQCVKYSVCYT